MVRILHTADIHLDSPLRSLALRNPALRDTVATASRAAFRGLVEAAIAEGVAAMLISGDLFDGRERSAGTGAFVTAQMDRLAAAGIRVFYIKGNHDAENPVTGSLDLPGNVHVFDAAGGRQQLCDDIWIHGVSFAGRHAPDSLLPRFRAPVPGAVNIAMLHTSLGGAPGHDTYAPCSPAELAGMGFDYWALGHVHRRQIHSRAPWIVMPGMPQGRDIGEAGPKSATLLEIDGGRISLSERPSCVVEFAESALDAGPAESDEALRAMLRAHLAGLRDATAAGAVIVRLTLTGRPARSWQILRDRDVWNAQAAELAQQLGGIWIDRLVFDLAPPAAAQADAGATGELAEAMDAIRAEPGFAARALAETEAVLQDLPPGLRDRLAADARAQEALAERLSRAGAERVLARMKGAEAG
ncbi:metallophosphoesterase family protein [Mangrovicoccus algicola]|uniref:DNA repair exonuclease n=1 Tax=Mangrovicoccus algicola TaxID=2771008 RepID=A0A8J7CLC0_9RHOB|nr:DNA repair exonuclease [Mangrovicoccus algicola]MBE3639751.1 DNA repair exonuclease [Mangrovicoccus algicola]